ncbi:hypothetical protein LH51_09700 [Nitrincola sp. A-D6]|nr:hypothetical protein LH51_09700 [Nitrincola sp. A-D6]
MIAVLAGCDQGEQTPNNPPVEQPVAPPAEPPVEPSATEPTVEPPVEPSAEKPQPLGQTMEIDGFMLRANVSRTDDLPDAMAQQYGISADPDLSLLNLVILENQSDQQDATVSAEVSAQYESLTGQLADIEMRTVEADGYVSYIGTLDTSSEHIFKILIKAQPANTDQVLEMEFEVQLDTHDTPYTE